MIAQNADPMFRMAIEGQGLLLMDLPDEILVLILSFLDLETTLKATRVCKHLDQLCDKFLYHNSRILRGTQAVQLAYALNKDKTRLGWVKSLLVSTKFGEDSGLTRLPPHLQEMRNLEVLRLETPDCNSRQPAERMAWIQLQDMYETVFERSSLLVTDAASRKLTHLRECTLHFVDSHVELYSLTRYASIFLHPNLRSLTLSCASTDTPERLNRALRNPVNLQRSTNLEYLFLEECDINSPSLAYLLSFPRALKHFKFSEGVRYDGLFRTGSRRLHGNVKPHQLMDALTQSCSESLESLSLTLGYRQPLSRSITDHGEYLNMTKMTKLKFIEVECDTLDLIRNRVQCDHKLWLRLPPSLETFKISNIPFDVLPFEVRRGPQIPLETCFIREKAQHGVPNLKTVIFSYDSSHDEDNHNAIGDVVVVSTARVQLPGNPTVDDPLLVNQDRAANNNNVGVNLGNAIAGPANAPIHPPQPPVANGRRRALLNNNLDIANPDDFVPAYPILRRNWLAHANRSRATQRDSRGFSQFEMVQIALLQVLNNEQLPQYRQHNTRLIVDLVRLPSGFIPPYLFPEEQPTTLPAWWSSDEAKETEAYKREFCLAKEAKVFERNLRRERLTRRVEGELQDLRQRIRRGDYTNHVARNFLTPGQQEPGRRNRVRITRGALDFDLRYNPLNAGLPTDNDNDDNDYVYEDEDEDEPESYNEEIVYRNGAGEPESEPELSFRRLFP